MCELFVDETTCVSQVRHTSVCSSETRLLARTHTLIALFEIRTL